MRYVKLVDGVEIDMTPEEIAERQAEENTPASVPLSQVLNTIFESLPLESQADLAPLKAAVKLELEQGRLEMVKLIIQRAAVPVELEVVKTQMLNVFGGSDD